jgi:lysophospholipase L1-like esterase
VGLSVDDGPERVLALDGSASVLRVLPKAPMATLRLRLVAGQVTLHGLAPAYAAPSPTVVDVFSLPGATGKAWNPPSAAAGETGGRADYGLALLQYGTNEAADAGFQAEDYAKTLRGSLARFRTAYPTTRCVLLGPPDRGSPAGPRGRAAADPERFSRVHHEIASVQRRLGAEFGCGFWDWQAAMGGAGAARRWALASPPLMQDDLTHLTARGYEASARSFAAEFPLAVRR